MSVVIEIVKPVRIRIEPGLHHGSYGFCRLVTTVCCCLNWYVDSPPGVMLPCQGHPLWAGQSHWMPDRVRDSAARRLMRDCVNSS